MSCNHHPDDSTLLCYGAGSLPDALAMVVACHLAVCDQCYDKVVEAEQIGLGLMEQEPVESISQSSRDWMLAMLDESVDDAGSEVGKTSDVNSDIPEPLCPLIGHSFSDLHWRTMAPGMKQFILPASRGKLRLLKIAPGTFMPSHGHSGSELTLVLKGSYSDELGRFSVGDVADVDPDMTHQPVADTHEGCICLIATDGPLRFKGLVPRLLQPFFQL
ncbi:ChrR family anti-sigma-E factor [Endozoicomonas sp. SCSIO W0465]|uniref:ChrR family anti-sigma-E factor n=1 Tax=Endozoicomonas sp. SCSIO W0465 TaxID=2918516 RepID=UPI002076340F|nr:ChrR family anti-sigma-E factor [Endozoicomonas sp. SCSIO W0465]USE37197.1 ChrR family anti-sigma-E factor [Endozoicomonas sp. SCSIO W0465]